MRVSSFGPNYTSVEWTAQDHGFVTWSHDFSDNSNNGALPTAGTVYLVRCHNPFASAAGSIWIHVASAGGSLTAGQCFAGVYQNGTLLGATADQATAWGSTGVKQMAISGGPVAMTAGDVYVALLFNGTTGPSITRSNTNTGMINVNLSSNYRFGTANTGVTALPGSLGAVSAQNTHAWMVALSAT